MGGKLKFEYLYINKNKKMKDLKQFIKTTKGLNILSGYGTQSDTKQKQVEANSLELSMKPEAQPITSGVGG